MSSHNFETLKEAVLGASLARRWKHAVEEWQVTGVDEDPRAAGVCVCGKTGLVYLFTIHNRVTNHELSPIGSHCVNLFEVEDLDLSVTVLRRLLDLRASFAAGRRVELTTDHFSRAVLADLWESGAFPASQFNHGDGYNDYLFLLGMFNQRHDPTDRESAKVWVLINRTIRPFVLADPRLG